jgi:hypothetical protein
MATPDLLVSGDPTDLTVVGPQGERGQAGPQGVQGSMGPQGPEGTTGFSEALEHYLGDTPSTGLAHGGTVARAGGLTVNVGEGHGFITADADGPLVQVEWGDTALSLTANESALWIIVDAGSVVREVLLQPDPSQVVILGDAATGPTQVTFLASRHVDIYSRAASQHVYARDIMGPLCVSGGIVTQHAPGSLALDADACTFYVYDNRKVSQAASPVHFTRWYRDGVGGWKFDESIAAFSNYWDDGSGTLAPIQEGKWKRSALYVAVNDGGTEFHAVFSQQLWDDPSQALLNPVPPDLLRQKALLLAAAVSTYMSTDFYAIYDQRPKLGQLASGGTAVTLHSQLGGLSADDHKQYVLRVDPNPWHMMMFLGGPFQDGEILVALLFELPVTFAANLDGCGGKARTPPAAQVVLGISFRDAYDAVKKAGTITVATDGTLSFSLAGGYTTAPGDTIVVTAPSPADGTLGKLTITLVGTR